MPTQFIYFMLALVCTAFYFLILREPKGPRCGNCGDVEDRCHCDRP